MVDISFLAVMLNYRYPLTLLSNLTINLDIALKLKCLSSNKASTKMVNLRWFLYQSSHEEIAKMSRVYW